MSNLVDQYVQMVGLFARAASLLPQTVLYLYRNLMYKLVLWRDLLFYNLLGDIEQKNQQRKAYIASIFSY
jgi:hypothetical protein